jgi:salicylate hydroxylase
MRVLKNFGFDPKSARGVQNKQMRMVDPHTLEDLIVQDFGQVENDYNAPFMFFHRVDLHTALKDMAVSRDLPGTPAVINNGQVVSDLNCGDGTIVLENGEIFHKDLIVIADGVRVS